MNGIDSWILGRVKGVSNAIGDGVNCHFHAQEYSKRNVLNQVMKC